MSLKYGVNSEKLHDRLTLKPWHSEAVAICNIFVRFAVKVFNHYAEVYHVTHMTLCLSFLNRSSILALMIPDTNAITRNRVRNWFCL